MSHSLPLAAPAVALLLATTKGTHAASSSAAFVPLSARPTSTFPTKGEPFKVFDSNTYHLSSSTPAHKVVNSGPATRLYKRELCSSLVESAAEADAKLQADAEAFVERMLAKEREKLFDSTVTDDDSRSAEAVSNESKESSETSTLSAAAESPEASVEANSSADVEVNGEDNSEIPSMQMQEDADVAAEWQEEQMDNAVRSVVDMNAQAAMEAIEVELANVAQDDDNFQSIEGRDDRKAFEFQTARLERQLAQPMSKKEKEPAVISNGSASVNGAATSSKAYAFQQSRLERQLAQPTSRIRFQPDRSISNDHVQPQSPSLAAGSIDTYNFQRSRLVRQLAQASIPTEDASPSVAVSSSGHSELTHVDAGPSAVSSADFAELSAEEEFLLLEARRIRFQHIENMCADVVRRASEAADAVVRERENQIQSQTQKLEKAEMLEKQEEIIDEAMRATAVADLDDIEEALSVSAQPASDELVMTPSIPAEPSMHKNKASILPTKRQRISHQEITNSLLRTVSPERSVMQYAEKTEVAIALYAAYHFGCGVVNMARATIFSTIGVVESIASGAAEESSVNPDAIIKSFVKSERSESALSALGRATNEISSFIAATGALGYRLGQNARNQAVKYQHNLEVAQEKARRAQRDAERRKQSELEKIVAAKAEEERIKRERVDAERLAEKKARRERTEKEQKEKLRLAILKQRLYDEEQRIEHERIAAEESALRAIQEARRIAEEKTNQLQLELKRNGLEGRIIKVKNVPKKAARATFAIKKPKDLLFFAEELPIE